MFSLANQKKQTKPKNLNKRKKTLQEKLYSKTKSKYQRRNIQIKQVTGNYQTKKSSKIDVKNDVINCSKTMPK
jgi:phosphopantetheine adenylyltransferase